MKEYASSVPRVSVSFFRDEPVGSNKRGSNERGSNERGSNERGISFESIQAMNNR
jgi:hypothetical protein